MQERRNSSVLAMELHISCTKPLICECHMITIFACMLTEWGVFSLTLSIHVQGHNYTSMSHSPAYFCDCSLYSKQTMFVSNILHNGIANWRSSASTHENLQSIARNGCMTRSAISYGSGYSLPPNSNKLFSEPVMANFWDSTCFFTRLKLDNYWWMGFSRKVSEANIKWLRACYCQVAFRFVGRSWWLSECFDFKCPHFPCDLMTFLYQV